jgi:hypothetical protein
MNDIITPNHESDAVLEILSFCNEAAGNKDTFEEPKGAGDGDKATAKFLAAVQAKVEALNSTVHYAFIDHEKAIYVGSKSKFDFYIESEATVVEIALSLKNPASEFEKDILKVLVFNQKHINKPITQLVFIGKAGANARCQTEQKKAFVEWAKNVHNLTITIHDICPSS